MGGKHEWLPYRRCIWSKAYDLVSELKLESVNQNSLLNGPVVVESSYCRDVCEPIGHAGYNQNGRKKSRLVQNG